MDERWSYRHLVPFLFIAFLTSCNLHGDDDGDNLVVSVYDKTLTKSEVRSVVPQNASFVDSVDVTEKYIQEWVSKELLLQKAKLNIGESDDIQEMVQEYKNSLLVSRYLQLLVDQKADNEPKAEEIETYFNQYKDNFLLQENIIRGSFLKLRSDAPRLKDVQRWLKSDKERDSLLLDDYCFQNATNYERFGESWISMTVLSNYLPEEIKVSGDSFKSGKIIEQSDSLYLYFLKLEDVKLISDTAPLEYVSPRIYKILSHQKKLIYLSKLKKSIYNEAIKDKIVVFHDAE